MMLTELTRRALAGEHLEAKAIEEALDHVMQGSADPVQLAGFLVALAARPPEAFVLAAAARAMSAHRVVVRAEVRPLIDTCGTGGDGAGTFNVSTAAAFVVAAAGAAVAKHGGRGVSSRVGSADVLEAAGCGLSLSGDEAKSILDSTGFVFLYAPAFHPAMRHVAPVRKSLGIRTIFNLLGPLSNPALAERRLLGVYDARLTGVMAEALRELGCEAALVVHCEGLDEIGLHAPTTGHRLRGGRVEPFQLDPRDLGVERAGLDALRGGDDAATNAEILRRALTGEGGALSDIVALNAAAALELCGMVEDMGEGLALARKKMASGAALRTLDRYAASSRRAAEVNAVKGAGHGAR